MDFAFTTEVPVRYSDLDTYGHVNNGVYATYVEEGRVDYLEAVVGMSVADLNGVVASLSIEFERPITERAPVEVALGVSTLGESSFTMVYELRAGDDVAATAETVQVAVDPASGDPVSIPEEWRDRIVDHEPHL